jgi:anti-sigma B factor antagonist
MYNSPTGADAGPQGTSTARAALARHPGAQPMPEQSAGRLDITDVGDITVINFLDRNLLDEELLQAISDALNAQVDGRGRRKLLVSLKNVDYLASAALGTLISYHKKVHGAGGRLVLCGMAPHIHEVFAITRLDRYFTIVPEEQEALQSL